MLELQMSRGDAVARKSGPARIMTISKVMPMTMTTETRSKLAAVVMGVRDNTRRQYRQEPRAAAAAAAA